MRKCPRKIAVALFICIIGISFAYKVSITSAKARENNHKYPLPLAVEVLIPRHADILWHSAIHHGFEHENVAVLYSTPIIGANDSLKYLELFTVYEDNSVIPRDRIYLGGRGLYVVDKVTEKDKTITVHAREHQAGDCIANPTRHVNIIVQCGRGAVTISQKHP